MCNTIKMGNDEFILYIRKQKANCSIENSMLGKKIWIWIKLKDENAIQTVKDMKCLWISDLIDVIPNRLPNTATQFEFDRSLLPELYSYLDELAKE